MKKTISFLVFICCLNSIHAQDTIVLKSMDVIIARDIKKSDDKEIAFNRQGTYYEAIDTNTYTIKKKNVAGIIYHNGHKDSFDAEIMNSYIANRQKSHVLYTTKDLKQESSFNYNPEKASYAVKWNPALFLSNDLAFSFEYKKKNNAIELELGYIYPLKFEKGIYVITPFNFNFTNFCYNGISANIFLKHYCRGHFYYSLSALFKYECFKNTWFQGLDEDDTYQDNINCSQTREVYGLAFRCGFLLKGRHLCYEPYADIGLRVINSKTTYNYYIMEDYYGSNSSYNGQPDDVNLFLDEGLNVVPYLNAGFKVGFGWNGKK